MNILKRIFRPVIPFDIDGFVKELQTFFKAAPSDIGGGCSIEKALIMAMFIKELKLKTSADIGVYRGRSLFPQAIAHKKFTGGIVYGIDPYDNDAAVQNDSPKIKDILEAFARDTNFDQIFYDVCSIIKNNHLNSYTKMVRETSHNATDYFLKFNVKLGLVHIDGNHDTAFVMQDIDDYFALIQDGGIVVLDDISWDSVKPALRMLEKKSQ
jgi:hypothetical protein